MACCDASASGPAGVVECAFGVAVVAAFDRVPFVAVVVVVDVVVGVVVAVAVVESVVEFASFGAAVEIAGVAGDGVEWEERLAIAVRGLETAPGLQRLAAWAGAEVAAVAAAVVGAIAAECPVVVVGTFD